MNEELARWLSHAEHDDLRPQLTLGTAVSATQMTSDAAKALTPILVDRFLQLKRPIADASASGGPHMRLQDAGSFFYLIETLKRVGYEDLEQTLCILLDEFAQLDERSYDELYLWCLVELSRTDPRHVDVYWPQVLALDRRYRGGNWYRPEGVHLVEQPYRLTELLFYFYLLYTLQSPPPTLGSHLKRLVPYLGAGEIEIARRALEELAASKQSRPAFGDALGLLPRRSPAV
jgi:hypothetical protein